MRDAILGEFGKRTGITPRPFVNPSTQVRVDRLRTAPVDCVLLDAPFAAYANSEKLLQPIDISRLPNWSKLNALLKDGRATPTAPLGYGANPGRMMYLDEARTKVSFAPMFFQMDSIGYNASKIPAENNTLSWGELFNPKWRGKVAMFGIDWLGMLNAAMGMRALGLLDPKDISNMTEKEVDTVTTFLKEKKKEGHFRAMWKAYGELVNLMASRGGLDRRRLVAGDRRSRRQGHPRALRRRQGRLSRLVQRLRHLRRDQEPRRLLRMAELLDGRLSRGAAVGDRLLLDRQQLREIPRSQAGEGGLWRRGPRRRLARPTAPSVSSSGTRGPRTSNTIRRNGTNSWLPELISAGMTRPLTLLLSAHALKTWGTRIEAAVPSGGLAFRTAEEALANDGPCEADIAFMTREVTGRSSKNNPRLLPRTQGA